VSLAFRCEICDGMPGWRIERQGDAVVSWACDAHLSAVCDRLQRDWEVTRLVVIHQAKLAETAEINTMLRQVAGES
jgi:hypothetical protein